ncbi:MAG: hypothetical protein WBA44_01185 [Mesorhizobium sp.]
MSRAAVSAVAMIILAAGAGHSALAQESDRYSIERTDTGYVRMDRQTGEMSICNETRGELVCRLAADDRDAYEGEIDRLAGRLDAVEKRLAALEQSPPSAGELPSDETVDRSISIMERFFRSFFGIMRDLEKEQGQETPATPPART